MHSFEYHNPVRIFFGKNTISKISKFIPINAKILITYGGGSILKNGILKQVQLALSSFTVFEFGGIEANPEYETLIKAVEIVKSENIDFLLAVGGGSVLDGTKFISAAAKYQNGDPWDILSKNDRIKDSIALASIMTLPATGSEMNPYAVISRREYKQKLAFGDPLLFPKFSVLDPLFLKSLPKTQRINGVIDTFIHVLEQYLTYPNQAEVQDRWAEGILLTLRQYGPQYVHQEYDYDVAANIMWSATSALNGLLSIGVPSDWATHAIGHEITALFGLDHAQTLAIIMPGMMQIMQDQKRDKLKRYAKNVFDISEDDFTVEKIIKATENFFHALDIKTRLSDYQIYEDDFKRIVKNLAKGKEIKLGETGQVNEKEVYAILRAQS
ncbi:MAG: iron-containing alcohol dehydrogenase [Bacteroidales bacterium]|nr:iron-containing alcohol dehydrogenase [Bacteroidales bacterium]